MHAQAVAEEFQEHAREEQEHADRVAERITQFGGAPDLNPEGLVSRSHSEYIEGDSPFDSYAEMVRYLGDDDSATRRMMEEILATEEEHAEDLRILIEALGKGRAAARPLNDRYLWLAVS